MERILPPIYERMWERMDPGHHRVSFLLAGSLRKVPVNPQLLGGTLTAVLDHMERRNPEINFYLTFLTPEQYGEEGNMNTVVCNTLKDLYSPLYYGSATKAFNPVIDARNARVLLDRRGGISSQPEVASQQLGEYEDTSKRVISELISSGEHGFLPNTPEGYQTFHLLGHSGETSAFIPDVVASIAGDYCDFLRQKGEVSDTFADDLYRRMMFYMAQAEGAYSLTDKPYRDSNEPVVFHAARTARYMMDALMRFGGLPEDPDEFIKGYIAALEHDSWEDLRPIELAEDDSIETRHKKTREGKNIALFEENRMVIVRADGLPIHSVDLPSDLQQILQELAAQNELTYLQTLLSREASFWARKVKAYGDRPDNFFTYPAKKPLIAMLRKAVETCFTAGPIGVVEDNETLYDTSNRYIRDQTISDRCYLTLLSQLAFIHAMARIHDPYVQHMSAHGYTMMDREAEEALEQYRSEGFMTAQDLMQELSMEKLLERHSARQSREGTARFSLDDVIPHTSRAADYLVYGKKATVRGPGMAIPLWKAGSRKDYVRKKHWYDPVVNSVINRARHLK